MANLPRAPRHYGCRTPAFKILTFLVLTARLARGHNEGHEVVPLARASAKGARSLTHVAVPSTAPPCPSSCTDLFSKLEASSSAQGKVQNVEVQIRGEPKSGTGMTQEWAWGGLAQLCVYLQNLYGEKSCQIIWKEPKEKAYIKGKPHSVTFEPSLADQGTARCACHEVQRVKFLFSAVEKHRLPVDHTCAWAHSRGYTDPNGAACKDATNNPIRNREELWSCVKSNACPIVDGRLQVAVIRDPRAVAVSYYFQHVKHEIEAGVYSKRHIDEYFQKYLEPICKWISIRYLLFTQLLSDQSLVSFYEEGLADPAGWYRKYYNFVGVTLPEEQIQEAARAASGGGGILGYYAKGLDPHPDAENKGKSRSFRDELGNSSLSIMDDVLRLWLPDVLLEKYGVSPDHGL